MTKVLITRPEHDPGTKYLSCWSERIILSAKQKNIEVIDLYRNKAVRRELEGRLSKAKPSLVVLNGHGSDNCVTGHNNENLIVAGENSDLLKGKVTYAVSCNSAKKLGEVCADENTAYIGYDESFVFNANSSHLSRPLEDERAGQFLQASNQVALLLIKGHTAVESSNGSRKLFKEAIKKLLPSITSDPHDRDDVADLFWDMNHQVCKGNTELKI